MDRALIVGLREKTGEMVAAPFGLSRPQQQQKTHNITTAVSHSEVNYLPIRGGAKALKQRNATRGQINSFRLESNSAKSEAHEALSVVYVPPPLVLRIMSLRGD